MRSRILRRWARWDLAILLSLGVSACAHPQAKTVVSAADVPLDVPAAPPRAVEPITTDALPAVGAPPNEPVRNVAPRPARPAPSTATPPRADAPRVETPAPADASKPSDDTAPKPAATPGPATPTLQTTPAQQEPEVEARIRSVLARATSDLSRIDYNRLPASAKTQYDQAKRFVGQSDEAIRARNLLYAGTLADKAAELAAQLAGR